MNGSASGGANWPATPASTPSHITGAIAGAARRFAGSETSESCSKCSAISGAVPTVAATVIAVASASGSGIRRASRRLSGAAPISSAIDRGERELPARFARRAGVEHQRRGGRQQQRVPAPRRTPGERRDQARDAHHSRPLDRRSAAGQRDVEEHHRGRDHQPRAQRHADQRARREHEHDQQHHVLPADREDVGEAGALEVVAHVLGQALVLAQHHPAQERRFGRLQTLREPAFGAAPHAVQRARDPASAGAVGSTSVAAIAAWALRRR